MSSIQMNRHESIRKGSFTDIKEFQFILRNFEKPIEKNNGFIENIIAGSQIWDL